MILNIRHRAINVRKEASGSLKGADKFTGAVTYSVTGSVDRKFIRLALGTEEEKTAIRRVKKIETACAVGSDCDLWSELADSLPLKTFRFFADKAGYVGSSNSALTKSTWSDLKAAFQIETARLIANKQRGATRKEGIMSQSTADRYAQTLRHMTAFLNDPDTPLNSIQPSTIEKFKIARHKAINELAQSRGGSSIALDIAVLHRLFKFATERHMMSANPINLGRESSPGENPKNGARPFTADELSALRKHSDEDLFALLVLRWTGLRGSDAVVLRWENVHFDRGANGEIEILTQKRSKPAIIPLSTELKQAMEGVIKSRYKGKIRRDDAVLYNPDTDAPFSGRKCLYVRMLALGKRASVRRATPHCFRDTFACDMLARGEGVYGVAQMLADTVDTVEKHYAAFVPASRDAAQSRMDSGIGIEERAKIAKQRGKKLVAIR